MKTDFWIRIFFYTFLGFFLFNIFELLYKSYEQFILFLKFQSETSIIQVRIRVLFETPQNNISKVTPIYLYPISCSLVKFRHIKGTHVSIQTIPYTHVKFQKGFTHTCTRMPNDIALHLVTCTILLDYVTVKLWKLTIPLFH